MKLRNDIITKPHLAVDNETGNTRLKRLGNWPEAAPNKKALSKGTAHASFILQLNPI